MEKIPDIYIFLGRFHSIFVHLPIGFLSLAILLEILTRWDRFAKYKTVMSLIWLLALWSAILSVLLGYSLSLGGGYNEQTLSWHRLGGFAIIFLSFICYLLNIYPLPFSHKASRPVYYFFVMFQDGFYLVPAS